MINTKKKWLPAHSLLYLLEVEVTIKPKNESSRRD
jgi:hypothetical protein